MGIVLQEIPGSDHRIVGEPVFQHLLAPDTPIKLVQSLFDVIEHNSEPQPLGDGI